MLDETTTPLPPREDTAPLPADSPAPASSPRAAVWLARLLVVGLVLAAVNLRPAITSLGSLLEDVRAGLHMSGSVAGVLTSVPALCFAVFGVTAPRLARRFGPATVVCAAWWPSRPVC